MRGRVGDVHDRRTVALSAEQILVHHGRGRLVEPVERFVEQEQSGVVGGGADVSRLLSLPERQVPDQYVPAVRADAECGEPVRE